LNPPESQERPEATESSLPTAVEAAVDLDISNAFRFVSESRLPTPFATFNLRVYLAPDGKEHLAVTLGDLRGGPPPLLRLHSECLTGDALFSLRCDCGFQLEHALQRIAAEQRGVLLYLRQEGRGIGLANKIRAYALQDQGHDTVEANTQLGFPPDARDYSVALDMLRDLGVAEARLMTNNPRKVKALESAGIKVRERVPIECGRNPHNEGYLSTKAGRLGHLMRLDKDA
jgi:GTP cyclohydrolase II